MAGDIPDGQPKPAMSELDHVVPVAPDGGLLRRRLVPGGHADAWELRKPARQEAALQGLRDLPLDREARALDRERDAIGDQLK